MNQSRYLLFLSHYQRAFLQTCTLFLVGAKIPHIRSKIPDVCEPYPMPYMNFMGLFKIHRKPFLFMKLTRIPLRLLLLFERSFFLDFFFILSWCGKGNRGCDKCGAILTWRHVLKNCRRISQQLAIDQWHVAAIDDCF